MQRLIAKCGFDCGSCPSYKENLNTRYDRKRCSEGWQRYFGFRLSPEKILRCQGCMVPNEENPVRYWKTGCRIRKCAVKNGIENCAYCSDYPCEDVQANCAYIDRKKIATRLGAPIPEVDYLAFIEPYEGIKHLNDIRRSLRPRKIKKAIRVSVMPRITQFPDNLSLSKKEEAAHRAVHRLLSNVGTAREISYARQEMMKKTRFNILKILWAFGLKGDFEKSGAQHLRLESETYLTQKINSDFAKLKAYFEAMKKHGAVCKLVATEEKGWLTPKGGLRSGGWYLELSLNQKAGGASALKALQKYASRLDRKYAKNAFRYFAKADMRVFQNR